MNAGVVAGSAPSGLAGIAVRLQRAAGHRTGGVFLRGGAMAVAAVAAAWVQHHHNPGVLCPLRRFTGIPCPFCGGTTVFMDVGSGHPMAAVAASPLVVVGAICLMIAPLGPGRLWWRASSRVRGRIIVIALMGSEIWQLVRFGFLHI